MLEPLTRRLFLQSLFTLVYSLTDSWKKISPAVVHSFKVPRLSSSLKAVRGSFLDLVDDPFYVPETESARWISDGLLVIENGKIKELDTYAKLQPKYAGLAITDYRGFLITPGFIDLHIHYPQSEMVAAYGEQLLEWLNQYTFPTEKQFKDQSYAQKIASFFLDELLKNGTTTALVFSAVFPESVDAFFEEASRRHLRMITGKVMMDRNAPEYLCDTAQSSYEDSKKLIQKWHKQGRLLYAVTPRFAGTSSPEQLQFAGQLLAEFSDVYLQTHLSENCQEVALIQELFPNSQDYLNVYEKAGLVGNRSVFAHGIHLSDSEFQRLSKAGCSCAFCPTSNLFLGSGLFNIAKAKSPTTPIKVGFGTDIGAGTSFSMLRTSQEAYKVAQLQGQKLSSLKALFLATLGGAKALSLEDKIGSFTVGNEADFVVLDPLATPLMKLRNHQQNLLDCTFKQISDILFATMILGDERSIRATHIMGEVAYAQHPRPNP